MSQGATVTPPTISPTISNVNSSVSNLQPFAQFIGVNDSVQATSCIQVSLITDQNCTVTIQQSHADGVCFISDSYNYTSNSKFGITVQAFGVLFCVIVNNVTSSATTTFNLSSVLKPASASLPRSLDENGNIKTSITGVSSSTKQDDQTAVLNNVKAKTDNLDVALSSRTKPSDQQHAIIDSSALPTGASTSALQIIGNNSLVNLDVALSSRTKPSDQQHAIVDSSALPTGASTSANQVLQTTALNSIISQLQNDISFSESIWYDVTTPANFYIRTATLTEGTGVKVITFTHIDGTAASPTIANLAQVAGNADYEFNIVQYKAVIAGTGYSINDLISEIQILNMSLGTVVNTIWLNRTTNIFISTPTFSNLVIDDTYASRANQVTGNTSLSSIDTKTPSLGQAVAGSSVPVVLTAAQITTLTPTAAITGFSTEATLLSRTKPSDQQHEIVDSSALPTGASTSSLQTTGNNSLSNLDVALSSRTKPADQQHAIIDSSALPTGASTSALQTTGNNSLANLDVALSSRLKPADALASVTTITNPVAIERANLMQSQTAAVNTLLTVTLPAVSSQFHNITFIEITAYTTLARAGSATPIIVTTTNLNNLAFTFASAGAIGTTDRFIGNQAFSIKSQVVNTLSTIVCPAITSVIWRVNVFYNTSTV